jgi:hypothetical protein
MFISIMGIVTETFQSEMVEEKPLCIIIMAAKLGLCDSVLKCTIHRCGVASFLQKITKCL